jgi:hypothetical protein
MAMQNDATEFPHAPTRPLGVAELLAALAEDTARLSAPERDACRTASLLLREIFEPVQRPPAPSGAPPPARASDAEPEPEA